MTDKKKKPANRNKYKAFATNAVTDIHKTETDANIPVASDRSVEEAREWANDESRL